MVPANPVIPAARIPPRRRRTRPQRPQPRADSADEQKLKKAAGDFESILLASMWKGMKQSFGSRRSRRRPGPRDPGRLGHRNHVRGGGPRGGPGHRKADPGTPAAGAWQASARRRRLLTDKRLPARKSKETTYICINVFSFQADGLRDDFAAEAAADGLVNDKSGRPW